MNGIIQGKEIGMFKTISIGIGQSKNMNREGRTPRFLVIKVYNQKSLLSKKKNIMLFEDDLSPEIFTTLEKYAIDDPSHPGAKSVNLTNFKASPEYNANKEMYDLLLEFPGGHFATYHLQKGMCYQNTADGKPAVDKAGHRVMKSSISVFVQIDFMAPNANGGMETTYISPYSPEEQGSRIENTFYVQPVDNLGGDEVDPLDNIAPTNPSGNIAPTNQNLNF